MRKANRKQIDLEKFPDSWIYRKLIWFLVVFSGFYMGFVEHNLTDKFFIAVAMVIVVMLFTRGQYRKYKWSDPEIFDLRFGQMFILLALGLFLEGMLYLAISPNILQLRPNLQYAAGLMALMGSFFCMIIIRSIIRKPLRA